MSVLVPQGFRLAGVHCGIKRDAEKLDLALIVSDRDAVAAGCYTTNLVHAAPVAFDRARTPSTRMRLVVANSGNANACTGERGFRDCQETARQAAAAVGAEADQALVLSTGVIGHFLPMDKLNSGVTAAAAALGSTPDHLQRAARGIMTTDTVPKLAGRELSLAGRNLRIAGICKGAAMIGPKMATMLSVVTTDAALPVDAAASMLREIVDDTFNCISVEGHMSTNDTVLLLANGAAGGDPLSGSDLAEFRAALHDVCARLARAIPEDGEGVTHVITIEVAGCASRESAYRIAKTVADSPLVKTAIAGADPNWGRIVSAAGYAGVPLDPARIDLTINGHSLYRQGAPTPFDAKTVSHSIRSQRDTLVQLSFGEGASGIRYWTTDLTAEYVRLNADYTT